jgi:ankyrin repeat protein
MDHGQEHAVAAATAASEKNVLALVVYNPNQALSFRNTPCHEQRSRECQDEASIVFEHARNGNLERIKEAIENGFDPHKTLDRNGASLLLWAAGSGHLHIVNYLIEQCECSPNQEQEGKRSFSGRTPLHWSARNGHLNVVQYLVDKCYVDIDATTADGTTAFCWASWQGHLQVMKFLHQNGANVKKENSFGCTAVLWCAQGEGNIEMMEWMQSIGLSLVTTNSNGHGALHKSAQRKRRDLCEWLCNSVYDRLNDAKIDIFDNIGPDTEGCCPSDLAGMAGDDELALFIAKQETRLVRRWSTKMLLAQSNHMTLEGNRQDHLLHCSLPKWLKQEDSVVKHIANENELNVWESWGGVHRMQRAMPFSLTF